MLTCSRMSGLEGFLEEVGLWAKEGSEVQVGLGGLSR